MQIAVQIDQASAAGRTYLTWAPTRATVRLAENAEGLPVPVTLANLDTTTGGQLDFTQHRDDLPRSPTLDLVLPADGTPVEFWLAGVLGRPSTDDGDARLAVTPPSPGSPVVSDLMVRVRKDANLLTPAERLRFTDTLAALNDRGTGLFKNFREMHRIQIQLDQAHGEPGFLSWHRAYLLDLERELQKINPAVSLPYWRFDKPAPAVFSPDMLGRTDVNGAVRIDPGNKLLQWRTEGQTGISRAPQFDQVTGRARVRTEAQTLAMGGARPNAIFDAGHLDPQTTPDTLEFEQMEGDPHGNAHTSFLGWLRSPATAPRDPLFFLLHCNVDRLWARWQWFNNRFDGKQPRAYFFRGSAADPGSTLIGHNLHDTMWPWNGVTGGLRPPTAPRTPFPQVPTATAPGPAPTVGEMLDYQGLLHPAADMNFGYDDVPFGVARVQP